MPNFSANDGTSNNLSLNTLEFLRWSWHGFARVLPEVTTLDQLISPGILGNFVIAARERQMRATTVNTYIRGINVFLGWLHANEYISPIRLRIRKLRVERTIPRIVADDNLKELIARERIAEKFQAMVALDLTNTRIKDFYDVWRLSRTHEFEGATLAKAIETTFTKRSTALPEKLPRALTDEFSGDVQKQSLWNAFLRKGRLDTDGAQLPDVVTALRDFLMAPTIAARRGEHFNKTWLRGQWS